MSTKINSKERIGGPFTHFCFIVIIRSTSKSEFLSLFYYFEVVVLVNAASITDRVAIQVSAYQADRVDT